MTEIELIIDLHKNSERQGPGSEKETLLALNLMDLPQDQEMNLADIGCGSGGQTLTLAQHLNGRITAIDLLPEFLEELEKKSKEQGFDNKIRTLEASMGDLPFQPEEFDVIWSEGAIYNMGFSAGIRYWKDFLRKEGYLALSEINWTTNSRPSEIQDFWMREYDQIDTASNKTRILEENGFSLVGYFILSEESWTDHYYKPLQSRFRSFLEKHEHSDLAKKIVEVYRTEIELYMKYRDYYSYGFYVAQKTESL